MSGIGAMAIGPNTPQSQLVNWHVRGEAPERPTPEPNCMGRIIRWFRNSDDPIILKICALFIAASVVVAATLFFKIKLVLSALAVLPVLIWGKVEWNGLVKRETDAADRVEARRLRQIEQRNAYTSMQEAIGGDAAFHQLPVLDIGNREGSTGYIDFIETTEMTAPIMRGTDRYGRPFISMKLRERASGNETVITLFQRYAEGGRWTYGGSFGGRGEIFQGVFTNQDRDIIRQITVARTHPVYDLAI